MRNGRAAYVHVTLIHVTLIHVVHRRGYRSPFLFLTFNFDLYSSQLLNLRSIWVIFIASKNTGGCYVV